MPTGKCPTQVNAPWDDTIIAPATAPGEAGVSIIRVSGPRAARLLRRLFQPNRRNCRWASHRLYYGTLRSPTTGAAVDRALAVLMRAPHSYTGEDVAELHCHGSPLVVRRTIDLARHEGVRLANPGEFTLRAVLNGRLDLAQAESVLEIVRAQSERGLELAVRGLSGHLSGQVRTVRRHLLEAQAFLEASIDFSEDEVPNEDVQSPLSESLTQVRRLLDGAGTGLLYRSGVRLAIVGRPNVGKSSLLNALLRADRAIVTDIPGTTRDTLEESAVIGGIPMVLVDTAGLRPSGDTVERIGVERAEEAAHSADLLLIVLDGSQPLMRDDHNVLWLGCERPVVVAVNKSDLATAYGMDALGPVDRLRRALRVSALTGAGVSELEGALVEAALDTTDGRVAEEAIVSVPRHVEALGRAAQALDLALTAVGGGLPTELIAGEVSTAVRALGEITGENATEDLLDTVFSRFCLGK